MTTGDAASPIGPEVLAEFGVAGAPEVLTGGSRPVYRVGNLVLKRLSPTALEHDRSLDLFPWLCDGLGRLPQQGFRLPRPVRTRSGAWMTADRWTASTFVRGRHATAEDVPACIAAVEALHDALRSIPHHPLLDRNASVFGRADRACWEDRPAEVHPAVAPLVDALYARRRPVDGLQPQVIHGDLNPENILIAPGAPPAFLDVAPFWRPPEFALAIFANWIGPRRGDDSVLRHVAGVRHVDQLLIRAAIRMLLIMTNLDRFEASPEAQAARIVLDHVARRAPLPDSMRSGPLIDQGRDSAMNDRPIDTPASGASQPDTAAEAYLPLEPTARRGIALCLSGGGYRAALFHLGALRRLNEVGLLSRLDEISSVSGGSIISAHLATRVRPWPEPGQVFPNWEDRVARPFRAFTRRNIRTRPVLERLVPWNWLRSETSVEALAAEYRKYLTPLSLAELPERPTFIYCATDLTYGVNWVCERDKVGDYQAGYASPVPPWPLARAVAASSCFPPVFDPLPVGVPAGEFSGGKASGPNRDALVEDIHLSDGGVYDNMGLEPVWKHAEVVIVSDGGAVFDYESDNDPLRRIMRYIAVIGDQAGRLRKRWLITNFIEKVMRGTYWGIGSDVRRYKPEDGNPAQQPRVGYSSDLIDQYIETIRTDLDAFTPAEIAVLENHGYTLADAALRRHLSALVGPDIGEPVVPHPEWMDEGRVKVALKDSAKRTLLGRR